MTRRRLSDVSIVRVAEEIHPRPRCFGCCRRRRKRQSLSMPFCLPRTILNKEDSLFSTTFSADYLLAPPRHINFRQANQIRDAVKELVRALDDPHNFHPEVFLSFARGTRQGDAKTAGPGMFYAAAVLKMLFAHGIPCFSTFLVTELARRSSNVGSESRGLRYDNGQIDPHSAFLARLHPKSSTCKVLLLVETRDLYHDLQCLEQIHAALQLEKSVYLLSVRFEDNIPERFLQWTNLDRRKYGRMISFVTDSLVVRPFCPIPSPPAIMRDDPKQFLEVIAAIEMKTSRPVNWRPNPDPFAVVDEWRDAWINEWAKDMQYDEHQSQPLSEALAQSSPTASKDSATMEKPNLFVSDPLIDEIGASLSLDFLSVSASFESDTGGRLETPSTAMTPMLPKVSKSQSGEKRSKKGTKLKARPDARPRAETAPSSLLLSSSIEEEYSSDSSSKEDERDSKPARRRTKGVKKKHRERTHVVQKAIQPESDQNSDLEAGTRGAQDGPAEVRNILNELHLSAYVDKFIEEGFDSVEVLAEVTEDVLRELGLKPGHRLKVLKKVKELNSTSFSEQPPASTSGPTKAAGRRVGRSSMPDLLAVANIQTPTHRRGSM